MILECENAMSLRLELADNCVRQPQAFGDAFGVSSLMIWFASAGAERRVRRVPGASVLTASARAAATAGVDVATVAERRRPAAARVLDAAGGLLQADEKAWSSSLGLVGVSLTDWCVGLGVKTCVLLPRRIVFSAPRTAPLVRTGDLSKSRRGRAGDPRACSSTRASPLRNGLR
jgi:hypothetical protein